MSNKIGVALIGCGGIAIQNHVPGLKFCPGAELVALCDTNAGVLAKASSITGISRTTSNYQDLLAMDEVNAIIIATPNFVHAQCAIEAARAGRHILCEKPISMNAAESRDMLAAAQTADVRHMTAFTYRFVPAMRYMAHCIRLGLLGEPYHFRCRRQQDWGTRNLGWRQKKALAATGEIGDMLSHRLDFAHVLMGRIEELVADTRIFHATRGGESSDLEDWVGVMARFGSGATGMLESTKVATGRGEGGLSEDFCEVAGSEATFIYRLSHPNQVLIGKKGQSGLEETKVPVEFLKLPGSPRDPEDGDPVQVFRYDQDFEFIQAIHEARDCQPSFVDGHKVAAVIDAILHSQQTRQWVKPSDFI